MEIPQELLIALNGFTKPTLRTPITDLESTSKVFSSSVVKSPKYTVAQSIEVPPLIPERYKPSFYLPRLFGRRISAQEAADMYIVRDKALEIYQEIDRIFLPSNFEYIDGGIPNPDGNYFILRTIKWTPMELVSLPLSDDSIIRIAMNVEYGRSPEIEISKEYFEGAYA